MPSCNRHELFTGVTPEALDHLRRARCFLLRRHCPMVQNVDRHGNTV
jgi:hypothetical protein